MRGTQSTAEQLLHPRSLLECKPVLWETDGGSREKQSLCIRVPQVPAAALPLWASSGHGAQGHGGHPGEAVTLLRKQTHKETHAAELSREPAVPGSAHIW